MRLWNTACLFLLPLSFLLGACRATQGYEGSRRPERELALVDIHSDAVGANIWLDRVDSFDVDLGAEDEVEVLPGSCLLEGRSRGFGQDPGGTPFKLNFLARAGAKYSLILTQPTRSDRMDLTVRSRATDEIVETITIWP